jgi:hypothetical protein
VESVRCGIVTELPEGDQGLTAAKKTLKRFASRAARLYEQDRGCHIGLSDRWPGINCKQVQTGARQGGGKES